MHPLIDSYLRYVSTVRRYSPLTVDSYGQVLEEFDVYSTDDSGDLLAALTPSSIRNYEVYLLEDRGLGARSVNQHLSVLSGFCRYLMTQGLLKSNPVRMVTRPKTEKRLPDFYRDEAMDRYFAESAHAASEDELELLRSLGAQDGQLARTLYERRLRRLIVSILHGTGLRRAELASLDVRSLDAARGVLAVRGKGDKMREIPLVPSLLHELQLYLASSSAFFALPTISAASSSAASLSAAPADPLLRTPSGRRLYPVYIDRAVKAELGTVADFTGRKSPHVLRHTLATELLNDGSDLNAIKELLGHSSLAATQVYTHNSIERLKAVYNQSHPRAKDPSSSD